MEPSKRGSLTELAALLALFPGRGHASIDEAIWPGRRVSDNTRNTAMSKLRRWLGRDSGEADYLPRLQVGTGYRLADGQYRLAERADLTVTGVAQGQAPSGGPLIADVQYSYWIRPNDLGRALGRKEEEINQRAVFVLYDDGWRLEGEPRFP